MKPGDVVVGVLAGALETKVRPAVVIASSTYLVERPDVLIGILTTRAPNRRPPRTAFSRTGNAPGFERSPISERTYSLCIVRNWPSSVISATVTGIR